MSQIQKGDTFIDGQTVNASRLNQLIDSAILNVDAITAQTARSPSAVDTSDEFIISASGALRKTTAGAIIGSGLPVIASSITAKSLEDMTATPNDGSTVTGSTYVSADGITVSVSCPSAHGLSIGQFVVISGASSGYNGTFRLTAASGSSFSYVLDVTATAGSGSLTYKKSGSIQTTGSINVGGSEYVGGNLKVAGNINSVGNIKSAGTLTVTGNATFDTTEAIKIPVGTTVQRPATPVIGQTRYNSTITAVEVYDGTDWVEQAKASAGYIKAFCKVSGTTINSQFNIASVSNPSAGTYIFTFTTAMADANYVISAMALQSATSNFCYVSTMTGSSFTIITGYPVSFGGAFQLANVTSMMVSVMK